MATKYVKISISGQGNLKTAWVTDTDAKGILNVLNQQFGNQVYAKRPTRAFLSKTIKTVTVPA